jgi:hypothetical protein
MPLCCPDHPSTIRSTLHSWWMSCLILMLVAISGYTSITVNFCPSHEQYPAEKSTFKVWYVTDTGNCFNKKWIVRLYICQLPVVLVLVM